MNRFLLALIALLTGLVTQVSPAQARISGAEGVEIGAVVAGRSAARTSVSQPVAIDAPVTRQERRERSFSRGHPQRQSVYIPSVQLRIDRAHE